MSKTYRANLTIPDDDTYKLLLTLLDSETGTALDLTNFTADGVLKTSVDATTNLLEFSDSDYITLGGTAGTLLLALPHAIITALTVLTMYFRIRIIDVSGNPKRVIHGTMTIEL